MLLISACGNQSESMQTIEYHDAYSALLWQYYEAAAHLEAEEMWMFTFYDINRDGVPELIIWDSLFGSFFFTAHSAYTFASGDVHKLEIDESFGGRPASLSIFPPPNNAPGIIVTASGEYGGGYTLLNLEGDSLVINVSVTANTLLRDYGVILYYVRGIDATEAELHYLLYGLEDPYLLYQLAEEHDWMTSIGYVLVTETEANRVRDAVFGFMHEDDNKRPQAISETNIHNVWLDTRF